MRPWDRLFIVVFIMGFAALAGVDGKGRRPPGVYGCALLASGSRRRWCGVLHARCLGTLRENTFAAPVVKIQEGHSAIDIAFTPLAIHPRKRVASFLSASRCCSVPG